MKLLVNEAKLTGFWARNWATILTGFDLKLALWSEKVSGPFEKQASTVKKRHEARNLVPHFCPVFQVFPTCDNGITIFYPVT